jgi:hypothetical protein
MTFGQILDRTYRLMRAHWRLFLGVSAVPAVTILAFITVWAIFVFKMFGPLWAAKSSGIGAVAGGIPLLFSAVFLIGYPIMLAIYALYLPAAAFAATQADRGVVVTFRQAYSVAWSRFGRSLWLMILCILYIVVPFTVIAALSGVGAALMHYAAGVGASPGSAFFLIPLLALLYLAILVYSVWITLRFAVAYPACVEEDLTAWASLKRSASLTRGAMGRIFLVLLVVYAIVYALELVCILVFLALAAVVGLIAFSAHVAAGSAAFFILVGLGVLVYMLIIAAYVLLSYAAFTTSLAVIYHDQRLRKDGLAAEPRLA